VAQGDRLDFRAGGAGRADLEGRVQVLKGPAPGDSIVLHSEKAADRTFAHPCGRAHPGVWPVISLAGRDIAHAWGKFVFTGLGLGLLLGVTW
jgi:hypothetical protein